MGDEPASRHTGPRRVRAVAAFDFDGTVSRRDTLMPFVARVAGARRCVVGSVATGWSGAARRRFSVRDRDAVKAEMVRRLLTGHSERELARDGAVYAARLLDHGLRPEMVDQVRRHVAAGHQTLFVSASLVHYLRPIARYLHMTDVIAVELEAHDGVLSGSMTDPNVRAAQKAVRLRRWLDLPPDSKGDDVEIWAYGNSSGDHDLLAMADHAYWLGKPADRPEGAVQFERGSAF